MLRSLLAKFKRGNSSRDNKEEKKKVIKEWTSKIGVSWCDFENLLFWKDPRVSLAVFIIATGFFWKFISYKLQRIGLAIIAAAVPCSFPETRTYIWRYCTEKLQMKLNQEKRNLGFDCNDVYDFIVDCWVKFEYHYIYLLNLKRTSIGKFYLVSISYVSLLLIVIRCLPLAGMLYLVGTILYFYPILTYLDVFNIFMEHLERLAHPFMVHWSNSRTKRRRDRTRKPVKHTRCETSLSDIENEEFIPLFNKECETVLTEEILETKSDPNSSENDYLDEFQFGGEFNRRTEGRSSDYDEDSFLPSYNYQPDEMPSLSNFDSMMEPLDDEFHRGLDFRNITATSVNNSNTNFGLPNHSSDEDLTSEDIDDIPFEEVEHDNQRKISNERLFPSTRDQRHQQQQQQEQQQQTNVDNYDDIDFDVDQEFEFLDRTELYDVTDEEIMEQNVGGHSHSENVIPSVSNILGY